MNKSHGLSSSPEYVSYDSMMNRCYNQNERSYKNYGARGVVVCPRWKGNFSNFLQDMGNKPSESHSLDRIDNNGNYESSNCRWATSKEQARNRRSNVLIEHNGESRLLCQWAEHFRIDQKLLRNRLFRGWEFDKAIQNKNFKIKHVI